MGDIDRDLGAIADDVAALRRPDHYLRSTMTAGALTRLREWAGLGYPAGGDRGGKSSTVSDPTSSPIVHGRTDTHARDYTQLQDHLTAAGHHLRRARSIAERAKPVDRLDDPPDAPCGNIACTHVCTGEGNDRIRRPKGGAVGLCWRCFKHNTRHKRDWPMNAQGRDVRDPRTTPHSHQIPTS